MSESIKPRVRLEQESDGFTVIVTTQSGGIRVRIDQEETCYDLTKIFEFLGCDVTQEDVY